MNRILVIGVNSFRENVREKILYNLVLFALLLIGSSILLSRLHLGQDSRLILDLGLASMNIFGLLIAIFIGIGLVSKEIEKKTIYTIIAKPVARYEFLLGKYLGLSITLFVNLAIMFAGFLIVLVVMHVPIDLLLCEAALLIFMELMVITAVALLFSTFTTPTLSAIFTLGIYVIGHLTGDLKAFGDKLDATSRAVVTALYYAFPNLENFNLKGYVTHHLAIPDAQFILIVAYGLLYTTLLLVIAAGIFHRRDFR